MLWPAMNKRPEMPAATISTQNQSSCSGCWARLRRCFSAARRGHRRADDGCKSRFACEHCYEHRCARMPDSSTEKFPTARPPRGHRKRPLAKVRHDLRTPINHIIGFSEILLEEAPPELPENFVQDLQKIRAGGMRLLELLNQHLSTEAFPSSKPDQRQ